MINDHFNLDFHLMIEGSVNMTFQLQSTVTKLVKFTTVPFKADQE